MDAALTSSFAKHNSHASPVLPCGAVAPHLRRPSNRVGTGTPGHPPRRLGRRLHPGPRAADRVSSFLRSVAAARPTRLPNCPWRANAGGPARKCWCRKRRMGTRRWRHCRDHCEEFKVETSSISEDSGRGSRDAVVVRRAPD